MIRYRTATDPLLTKPGSLAQRWRMFSTCDRSMMSNMPQVCTGLSIQELMGRNVPSYGRVIPKQKIHPPALGDRPGCLCHQLAHFRKALAAVLQALIYWKHQQRLPKNTSHYLSIPGCLGERKVRHNFLNILDGEETLSDSSSIGGFKIHVHTLPFASYKLCDIFGTVISATVEVLSTSWKLCDGVDELGSIVGVVELFPVSTSIRRRRRRAP